MEAGTNCASQLLSAGSVHLSVSPTLFIHYFCPQPVSDEGWRLRPPKIAQLVTGTAWSRSHGSQPLGSGVPSPLERARLTCSFIHSFVHRILPHLSRPRGESSSQLLGGKGDPERPLSPTEVRKDRGWEQGLRNEDAWVRNLTLQLTRCVLLHKSLTSLSLSFLIC